MAKVAQTSVCPIETPANTGDPFRRVAPIAKLTTDRPNNNPLGIQRLRSLSGTSMRRRQQSIITKQPFTIATPSRLRRDSRPRFSTNHLDAKPIANPSSLNVVNLVPGGRNLGFHSRCTREHVFQLVRIGRYNDVEIAFLQQSIH